MPALHMITASVEQYLPYGDAYLWRPELIWMHALADIAIAIAYFTIPVLLARLARRRREFVFRSLVMCFAAFIIASGITHVVSVLNIWHAAYWLEATLKIITAILAVPTAILLWRSLPDALSLPSQRQLKEANDSLARANSELEAFTASVSHDLRSPLTTIAGQAGLLEMSMANANEEQRKRLTKIQTSVRQMSDLIEALLALSRISRHTLHREMIDVSALAHTIVADLRQSHPDRPVEVIVQPDLFVHGDRRLLGDLLRNLLANAWKFTAKTDSPRIEFGQSTAGAMATFYLRDNGAGFDMAHASKLFRPFHRLHSAAEFEGSGIGLATVARIVARHGGKVWAEATPHQGAVFYFTLPTLPVTGEMLAQQVRASA
jgi:signal transduction histidine kinase